MRYKVTTEMISPARWRRKTGRQVYQRLRRAGAYVRTVAKRTLRKRKGPSAPGSPPHTHTRRAKKSILYAMEGRGYLARVLVGPSYRIIGRAMVAHEFGGRYKGTSFPARPLMNPALIKSLDKIPTFWKGSIR